VTGYHSRSDRPPALLGVAAARRGGTGGAGSRRRPYRSCSRTAPERGRDLPRPPPRRGPALSSDDLPPVGAPRPGDPRSRGPRPAATPRDLLWGLLVVALVVVTAVQVVGLAVAAARLQPPPSSGGLVLGFLVTVVWLLTIYWLAMGAWRRSVWGCPFDHRDDAPPARRCPRHHVVPVDEAEGGGRTPW
jgi:hypothetical protein